MCGLNVGASASRSGSEHVYVVSGWDVIRWARGGGCIVRARFCGRADLASVVGVRVLGGERVVCVFEVLLGVSSTEWTGRIRAGKGHSYVFDVESESERLDESVNTRLRFLLDSGIGVPAHILSLIIAVSRCLIHRSFLGLSSSSSRSCRFRAGFLP